MGIFDSDDNIKAQVQASSANERSKDNSRYIRELENRLEHLEQYLGLEWSESNDKYYQVKPKGDK